MASRGAPLYINGKFWVEREEMDVVLPLVTSCGPAIGLGWFLRQSICEDIDAEVC